MVGAGMLGSAAARYLSESGASVAIIGPGEPARRKQHTGVFASHYDAGRITRALASDEVWAELAQRSINRYSRLETQAGIQFHQPCGFLWLGPERRPKDAPIVMAEAVGRRLAVRPSRVVHEGLESREWRLAAEGAVWSGAIVEAEPAGERSCPLG